MSDPVKSSEIEDVLASIRRLVSEEARSETQSRRQAAAEQTAAPPEPAEDDKTAPDALVLTPALRVHEGGRSTPVEDAPAPTDDVPEALSEAEPIEAIESVPEPAPVDEATVEPVAEAVTEVPEVQFEETASGEAPSEEAQTEDLPEPPSETPTLETKIAALEALISGSIDSRRTAPEAAPQPEPTPTDLAQSTPEDAPQEDPASLAWEDHLAEDETPTADVADTPADPVAAETTVELSDDTPELSHDPALPPEDAAPTDADVASAASVREDAPGADPVTIDEAMLREMVTQIVREELQGALGERITRNVRRLVRREIHRALAGHNLD